MCLSCRLSYDSNSDNITRTLFIFIYIQYICIVGNGKPPAAAIYRRETITILDRHACMGKPKPKTQAFRLLRSCLFFSGHKRDKEEAEAMDDVKLGLGGGDHPEVDGEGDVSAAVSSSPQPPQLPEDIIFDVLSRLPVKTLCRFRCVSKTWRALISSPAFASAQASRAAAPLVAGVFGTPRPLDKFRPARAPRFLPEASLELRVMDPADGGRVLRVVKDVKSTKLMCGALLGRLVMVDQGECGARVIDPATGGVMVLDNGGLSTTATTVLYSDGRTATAAGGGGDGESATTLIPSTHAGGHAITAWVVPHRPVHTRLYVSVTV